MMKDYYLDRSNMIDFLAALPQDGKDAITLYLPPDLSHEQAQSRLHAAIAEPIPPGLAEAVSGSKSGACLFWGASKVLVLPPFPVRDNAVFTGYDAGPLAGLLQRERL